MQSLRDMMTMLEDIEEKVTEGELCEDCECNPCTCEPVNEGEEEVTEEVVAEEIPVGALEQIRGAVEDNDHTSAYEYGASYLGMKKHAKIFQLIGQINMIEGHMPTDLYEYRQEKYNEMIEYARSTLPVDQFKDFHQAF